MQRALKGAAPLGPRGRIALRNAKDREQGPFSLCRALAFSLLSGYYERPLDFD